jgi:hypothetical protein
MKNLLFLLLILITLPYSFARDGEFESLLRGRFGRYDDVLQVTQQILKKAKEVALENGIDVQIENLTTETGELKTYPALRILPSPSSRANIEARSMQEKYGGLKLYLSPYDLKRSGANAFFKPDGSIIGVPAEFLYNLLSESYLHEKMHATTYLKLINAEDDTFAGVFKLIKGERMSERNSEGYTRFSSLDEFLATAFSAKSNCEELYTIYKTTPPSEFLKDEKNEELLSQILFNLQIGQGLTAQTSDLIEQSMKAVENGNYSIETSKISLGTNLNKEVVTFKILVNSTERVFQAGRGSQVNVANGVEIKLHSLSKDVSKLKNRLQKILVKAQDVEVKTKQSKQHIGVRIEFADLKTTNVEKLNQACQQLPTK